MMTKQQMQMWVNGNCKFAAMYTFADKLVSKIVEAKIEVNGAAFVKIIEAVLKKEIAALAPDVQDRLLKALTTLSKTLSETGPLTRQDMINRLVGLGGKPGLLQILNLPKTSLQDPDAEKIINEVLQNQRLKSPKTAPHTKETRDIDWQAARDLQNLNMTPRVPQRPAPARI